MKKFMLLPFMTVLLLVACQKTNEGALTADSSKDTSLLEYDPAMEPLTVGAKYSKKLGDTLGVKMYEFTVKPEESWGLHTHPDHAVYVLEGGKMALFIRESGRLDTLTLPTGMALISGPLSDSGKNVGSTTIKLLVADIYRPRAK
jgi:hypothetical protein